MSKRSNWNAQATVFKKTGNQLHLFHRMEVNRHLKEEKRTEDAQCKCNERKEIGQAEEENEYDWELYSVLWLGRQSITCATSITIINSTTFQITAHSAYKLVNYMDMNETANQWKLQANVSCCVVFFCFCFIWRGSILFFFLWAEHMCSVQCTAHKYIDVHQMQLTRTLLHSKKFHLTL